MLGARDSSPAPPNTTKYPLAPCPPAGSCAARCFSRSLAERFLPEVPTLPRCAANLGAAGPGGYLCNTSYLVVVAFLGSPRLLHHVQVHSFRGLGDSQNIHV